MYNNDLNINAIIPPKYKTNTNVNTQIIIGFNRELNQKTILDSFVILKDEEMLFDVESSVIDFKKYKHVEGSVTYQDKSIIFTPKNQLYKNSRYIIYIKKNSICDITGKYLKSDFISVFDTEILASDIKCEVIYPPNNSILEKLDNIEVTEIDSAKYIIQISKVKTFDVVSLELVKDTNIITEDFNLGDGLYYIRAKSLNGDFGETSSFSLKSYRDTTPVADDITDDYIYIPIDENELKILENALDKQIDVHLQTNVVYMKFNKIIPLEDIDFYESNLIGTITDLDDYDIIEEHGEVDGSFVVVHNEEEEITYVFYVPDSV